MKIFLKLLVGILILNPILAHAAISYDNDIDASVSGLTLTQSFTVTGLCSNRALYVWASNYKSGGVASGPVSVTYNGDAMTQFSAENTFISGQIKENVWYLLNPDSGTHDIVVTAPTSVDEIDVIAVSYCGVNQVAPTNIDRYNNTATNHESSLTVDDGSWLAIVGRNRIDTMSAYGSGANVLRMQAAALAWGDSDTPLVAGVRTIGLGTTGSSEFGSWVWEIEAASSGGGGAGTTTTATSTATLGDISFGLAIIITLLFLMTIGMFYNMMSSKKKI